MERFGTINFPMLADEEESCSASAVPSNGSFYSTSLQGGFVEECMASASEDSMASLCQSQQQCVKASIVSSWQLVEAQDQLCGLELHGSESVEQEHARAIASQSELSQTEQEWRRKESMLGGSRSPVLSADSSQDVFDKSIINSRSKNVELEDHDQSITFVQKYEQELRHFGMLRRWDDSQRFLSDLPHLVCEETANYLILWCFRLQAEEKEALMEQVAHQAVAMQFILEMARTSQQDPRGCFRQFFHKAKAGQEYLDVFHTELEAFKQRVKEHTVKCKGETLPNFTEHKSSTARCRPDPKEVLESLPPELKSGFQLQDMQILQNVLSTMNPQVAEYHVKRCLEAGLWNREGRWSKEEATLETDDLRMMET
ncbi:hsp90 co-chaperone Cdc37-like 1 [Salmo salar]|uniref:Hsp90 co-chaperone Cdc37-like 1 n=2 Tax=Salmo salar TaxID=8030 RepID=C0HBC0_SALSA|nr:hsp90 co-chaperone Cdc37-like 1 [Salmo salar]ACN11339.1 Hsp90 co-chaperone Cdc37-like 1 [Salmo salar]|eukprot:NP_001167312.1 hsp90 co-chaperone Cdc37-like 1 [Salmo salar]